MRMLPVRLGAPRCCWLPHTAVSLLGTLLGLRGGAESSLAGPPSPGGLPLGWKHNCRHPGACAVQSHPQSAICMRLRGHQQPLALVVASLPRRRSRYDFARLGVRVRVRGGRCRNRGFLVFGGAAVRRISLSRSGSQLK